MLQTEFVKGLQCNYERVLLDKKPEEKRYQYCILNRGGIKGLLPCSLRYINGLSYLYYDITSKQNVIQLFRTRNITREWMRDFLWSLQHIQQELGRFLLEDSNILWYPEQVFQDLEENIFSFLYIPYYEGDNGFLKFLEFMVEHINYEDDILVECVYKMYEQFDKNGAAYLREQIFEDAKILEREPCGEAGVYWQREQMEEQQMQPLTAKDEEHKELCEQGAERKAENVTAQEKRSFLSFFEGKRRKNKEQRTHYRQDMELAMEGRQVAEETVYEAEEYDRTIYIEESKEHQNVIRRLYTPEGKIAAQLNKASLTIGKKKEEVDLVLNDLSISRMHARIVREGEDYYLEDMNSTNGTFKNGLRMEPYEKRKLEVEDEIKLGKIVLIFR